MGGTERPLGIVRGGVVTTTEEEWPQGPSLVDAVWRFRFRILAAVVVCGMLGFWVSAQFPVRYSATTTILFRAPGESGPFETGLFASDPDRFVSQQASRVMTRTVLERAAGTLGGETFESLERDVAVKPDVELNRMQITASATTPERAAEIANAVAETFTQMVSAENLDDVEQANAVIEERITDLNRTVDELDQRLRQAPKDEVATSRLRTIEGALLALETQASELAANAAVHGSGIRSWEPAVPPEEPSSPKPLRDAALATAVGLGIASAVAYSRAGTHPRIEKRTDPGAVFKVPLLGEVPKFSEPSWDPGGLLPGSELSEAYQFVLSSIEFSLAEMGASSVLITSATAGEGKTTTALQLAVALAREARQVTLVDADVRARGLTTLLHAEGRNGLVQLADGKPLDDCIRRYRLSDATQLSVVPAGAPPEHSAGLMRAPEFKKAVEDIKREAELVIFDSSPILPVADALILASQVDAVVLVVDPRTELEQLHKVQERLAFVSTRLIGYIYNRASVDRATRYGYGYGSTVPTSPWSRLLRRSVAPAGTQPNGRTTSNRQPRAE
jgi:non-specific protein-tyrosine kinase